MSTHASWSKPNRSEHKESTLCVRVYLQLLTAFVLAVCIVSAPDACPTYMQVAVVMQACLLLLAGPRMFVACVLKVVIFLRQKNASACCNFASLLQSLHHLELPACCLAWPCVKAIIDNLCKVNKFGIMYCQYSCPLWSILSVVPT